LTIQLQPIQDQRAVPILLDRNPLHIDPRRRRVPVPKCILRLGDAPRGFAHPPGERVMRLVQLIFTCFRAKLVRVEDAMETQNITLSLPKEVLLKVKLLAVKRQTSVSGLLAQMLERLVQQEDAYPRGTSTPEPTI
jgi:hypothetical protein